MKDFLKKLITAKEKEITAIRSKIKASEDADEVRALGTTLESLQAEIGEAKDQLAKAEADEAKADEGDGETAPPPTEEPRSAFKPMKTIATATLGEARATATGDVESRNEEYGKALAEQRSITLKNGDVLLSKVASDNINDTWTPVSSVLDAVDIVNVSGAESFDQAFVKGYAEGDYTEEGTDYADGEPIIGYARVAKTMITAYAEISRAVQKLASAIFGGFVKSAVEKAVRRKLSRQIMIGDGADGHLVGIFATAEINKALDTAKDISLTSIDNQTLDEIVGSYGGTEDDGEGDTTLILNKEDLKAFSKLRSTSGEKLHTIDRRNKTIDTIPYIINSACKPISKSATTDGQYAMAYGNTKNYMLGVFSDIDVEESKDFKFKQGQVAYRADGFFGGNTVIADGFIRVKKEVPTVPIG